MTGGGFDVDLETLTKLVSSLEQASDRMTAANKALRSASATDLGSRDIDKAGGEVQDRWKHGIGKITEASKKITDGLRETQKVYREVEEAITKLFPVPAGGAQIAQGPATTSRISDRLAGGGA
jgi:uncharacterized protein YukE